MRFSGTDSDEHGPWFRIGSLEVTTTVFFLLIWAVSVVVFAAQPQDQPVTQALLLSADDVLSGELWRVITWPAALDLFTLFSIINAAVFWLFSTDIERTLGRRGQAYLLIGSILIISFFATLFGAIIDRGAFIWGFDLLALTVVLLFIAQRPTARFFFNIPAWAIGAVIVALEVVNDLAGREWVRLLTVFAAAGAIAVLAKSLGWLYDYDKIPTLRLPSREKKPKPPKASKGPSRKAKRRAAKSGLSEVPTSRQERASDPRDQPAPLRRTPPRTPSNVPSADDVALDLLLDKISDGGIDSLTPAERSELDEIQARRRKSKG